MPQGKRGWYGKSTAWVVACPAAVDGVVLQESQKPVKDILNNAHRAKGRFDDPKSENDQGVLPGLEREIEEPHTCSSGFCE